MMNPGVDDYTKTLKSTENTAKNAKRRRCTTSKGY